MTWKLGPLGPMMAVSAHLIFDLNVKAASIPVNAIYGVAPRGNGSFLRKDLFS